RREFYMGIVRSRHVDFVICHSQSMAPVLVVQVTDAGAKISADEQQLMQSVLDAASLPVLRLSARQQLGPVEMKQKLREAMNQMPGESDDASSQTKTSTKTSTKSTAA